MAKLESISGKFFFNLTADVGRNSPNRLDDVELVRYGYFCLSRRPDVQVQISPELKLAFANMRSLGPYGPDLQAVIDLHQQARGKDSTIDGKVSVGKPQITHSSRYNDKLSWIIFVLCRAMIDHVPDTYPRIDIEFESGNEIAKTVADLFTVN